MMIKKQYNIKGLSGLYLTSHVDYSTITNNNFTEKLIQDYNFYPKRGSNVIFKNVNFDTNGNIVGTNAARSLKNEQKQSEITKQNELILFEKYYVEFDFYFKFHGCDIDDSSFNSAFPQGVSVDGVGLSASDLRSLRIYLYADIGNNLQLLELFNLSKYNPITNLYDIPITGTTYWDSVNVVGIQQHDTIELGYPQKTNSIVNPSFFEDYTSAPNGYNFKLKAKLDITNLPKALSTKTFSIVVKYVSFDTEIPLLSRNYTYKVSTSIPPPFNNSPI